MRVNLTSISPIALVIASVTLAFNPLKLTSPNFILPVALAQPDPSSDPGTTPNRKPAGTRGDCPNADLNFTPLLPITESKFTGLTLKEYPTFIFYIPYPNNIVREGKLILEDSQGNLHARVSFELPQVPGFVSISVPTTEKPLVKNQQYRWQLMLYCEPQEAGLVRRDRVWHKGRIERVDFPELEAQLQTATLEERLNLYLDNQIWYDVATDFAQIRDLPQAWRKLFDAVEMEYYDREPISGPVKIQRFSNE